MKRSLCFGPDLIVQGGVGMRVTMRKVQCTMHSKSYTGIYSVENMAGLFYVFGWQTSVFIYIRTISLLCVTCFLLIKFVAVVSTKTAYLCTFFKNIPGY